MHRPDGFPSYKDGEPSDSMPLACTTEGEEQLEVDLSSNNGHIYSSARIPWLAWVDQDVLEWEKVRDSGRWCRPGWHRGCWEPA